MCRVKRQYTTCGMLLLSFLRTKTSANSLFLLISHRLQNLTVTLCHALYLTLMNRMRLVVISSMFKNTHRHGNIYSYIYLHHMTKLSSWTDQCISQSNASKIILFSGLSTSLLYIYSSSRLFYHCSLLPICIVLSVLVGLITGLSLTYCYLPPPPPPPSPYTHHNSDTCSLFRLSPKP